MAVKKDAINIAPFVDILLVLFVILVAASNFSDTKSLENKLENIKEKLLDKDKKIETLKEKLKSVKENSVLKLKELKQRLKEQEAKNKTLAKSLKKYKENENFLKREIEVLKKREYEHTKKDVDEAVIKKLKNENRRLEKIVNDLQKRLENTSKPLDIYIYPNGQFEVNGVKVKKREMKKIIEIIKPNISVFWPKNITPKARISLELLKEWYEENGGVFKWRE